MSHRLTRLSLPQALDELANSAIYLQWVSTGVVPCVEGGGHQRPNKAATVSSVVSEMGMVALLTRGLPLRIIMVGTLTGLQWGIYDAFKVAVGLPTTGSAAPPAKCACWPTPMR